MSRFSPTVLPDSRPRERPGLEIAQAFDEFREARGQEEEQAFRREDREIAAGEREEAGVDRTRRRGREDLSDAASKIEFERMVRDELGGVPVRGDQEVPGPTPRDTAGAFQDSREALGASAEPMARVDARGEAPQEVAVLPGQFAGGTFAPQAIMLGGQEFMLDPTQTAEARGLSAETAERERVKGEEEAAFNQEVQRLIAAGVDANMAPAVAEQNLGKEFVRPEDEGFDPDREGQFGSRDEFLAFQRELADAKDAVGRRPEKPGEEGKGPITLKDAFAEVDNIFGEWEGEVLVGHKLSEGQRLDVAQRMSKGELTPADLDRMAAEGAPDPEEDIPLQFEAGPIKRLFQGILPGGKTGLETIGTPRTAAEVSGPREETSVLPSREPPAVDTIRGIMDEYRDLDPEELKSFLLEEFSEEEVAAAFAGR